MPDFLTYAPRRCRKCGQPLPAGDSTELYRQMTEAYQAMYAPYMQSLSQMWGGAMPWAQGQMGGSGAPGPLPWTMPLMGGWPGMPMGVAGRREFRHRGRHHEGHHEPGGRSEHHYGHHHDCGCDEGDCDGCHDDDCHCRCCITDADLVIYARLGEQRVVALTIENPRKRERQVRLELSNWTTRSGSPASITGRVVPPAEFTLGPCSERDVIVVVEAGLKRDTPQADEPNREPAGAAAGSAANREQPLAGFAAMAARAPTSDVPDRRVPDVEHCEVFYADLRIEGCDQRPVRLALVLLPRDCASHPVDCGCGCC
jgi:hypothetical protein